MRCPIAIDAELCKACGICVALCPKDVFDAQPGGMPVAVDFEACNRCRTCEVHCPDFAIRILVEGV